MIRMFPTHRLSIRHGLIFLAGSHLRGDDFELIASHGKGVKLHTFIDERYGFATLPVEGDRNDWITRKYDYLHHEVSEEVAAELDVAFTRDFYTGYSCHKHCLIKDSNQFRKPRKTILIDRDGHELFSHESSLGTIEYDSPDFVCLIKGHTRTCVDKTRRAIAWQKTLRYYNPISARGDGTLLFLRRDTMSKESHLQWLDLESGDTVRSMQLPYALSLRTPSALYPQEAANGSGSRLLVFDAAQAAGPNHSKLFTLYFDLESGSYELFPRRDRTMLEARVGLDFCFRHTDCADLETRVVEDPSAYEKTFIWRFDTRTGEPAGEILLPAAKLRFGIDLFPVGTGTGTLALSRSEDYSFHYLALWDDEDSGSQSRRYTKRRFSLRPSGCRGATGFNTE
ncbi:MAG: hypothetical protein AAGC60_15715 [Acidobacteriota bacterium]